MSNKITLGDLAIDEFLALILDPKSQYYGYIRQEKIYPAITQGLADIDGGTASSIYTLLEIIDGGKCQ